MRSACVEMARAADTIASACADPREFLVEFGFQVAGIGRGPLAVLGLLAGGRTTLRGDGFRADLRDTTAGQARHFAGIARSVTLFGAARTEWLSVHVRRDPPDSPDGRLTSLAVEFAATLLDRRLVPAEAGDWIRGNVCD